MEISIDQKAAEFIKAKWPTIVIDIVKDCKENCDKPRITIGEPRSPEKYNWQYVEGVNIFMSDICCKRHNKIEIKLCGYLFSKQLNLICS